MLGPGHAASPEHQRRRLRSDGLSFVRRTVFTRELPPCRRRRSAVRVPGLLSFVVVTFLAAPAAAEEVRILTFSPRGAAVGHPFTVHGRGFRSGDRLFVGERECSSVTIVRRGRTLSCVVPVGAVTSAVAIVRDGERVAVSRNELAVVAEPQVRDFAPRDGAAGTQVTISGSGFESRTTVAMRRGRHGWKTLKVSRRSERELVVAIPPGIRDSDFKVCTLQTCTRTSTFDVHEPIPLLSIRPLAGKPGTRITVYARDVQGLGRFMLGKIVLPEVRREQELELREYWTIELEVPPSAPSGRIHVETYGVLRPTRFRFRVQK